MRFRERIGKVFSLVFEVYWRCLLCENITSEGIMKDQEINELSNGFAQLGAEIDIFVALHSWGNILPEGDMLRILKDQNFTSTSTASMQD